MRNTRASEEVTLIDPRRALSFLRGPMTLSQLRQKDAGATAVHLVDVREVAGAVTPVVIPEVGVTTGEDAGGATGVGVFCKSQGVLSACYRAMCRAGSPLLATTPAHSR
jgi:hypothetical protein